MPYIQLKPHVGYGLVDGYPVFLDLQRDRYFALDPFTEAAFGRVQTASATPPHEDEGIARLLATGLFVMSDRPSTIAPARIEPPARGLGSDCARGGTVHDALTAWRLLRRSRGQLRARRLSAIVAAYRQRADLGARRTPTAEVEALAARFLRARALVPTERVCLQDSLALLGWLRARSAPVDLVFGVKLEPFGAHCWVQSGDRVLNDALDTVSAYTPVMVVPCG